MLTLIFLVSMLTFSNCWVLKVSEKHVAKKLTNNVTFLCNYDGNDNEEAKLSQISRIRLLKFQSGNRWKTVAKLSDVHPEVVTTFSTLPYAVGHAGNRSSSYMSIRFDVATSDVIGQFICEVDGYDLNDELTAVKTDPVIITERGVSYEDLLNIILHLKSDEEIAHTSNDLRIGLLEKTVRILESQGKSRANAISKLTNSVNMMSRNFMKVSNDLLKKQMQILADLEIIKDVTKVQRQAWPEGVYTLMNTTSGCPGSFSFDWTTSSVRITTQQGNTNTDGTSNPIHVQQPVLETSGNYHYVNMRLCTKKTQVAGPAWPKGSYCVNQYNSACPKNLVSGVIQFDRENIGSYDAVTDLTVTRNADITQIKYCCRNDGDADTPVLLPAKDPFYLYSSGVIQFDRENIGSYDAVTDLTVYRNADITQIKYCCRNDGNADTPVLLLAKDPFYLYLYRVGGQCQEVIGMDVSEEWLYFDTKETKDAFIGSGVHPDASLKNIKLMLCYYTPKV